MLKGLVNMDDNISNLTFASGTELSASSTTRNHELSATKNNIINLYPTHQHSSANSTTIQSAPPPLPAVPPPPPLSKKKRNLPGNPDPDSEVIALSPKTLLTTNRFICEICNKGFQRDQNLQLHRRGHNLPWKLKQRSNKEVVRKKVYVCPETTCVHHDPSRALGDLTGIKKHFFRKHGEKKWKCEKCSKRYAVQSDWKAHSKICGTREYRCDCGTLFSRRDSFITHRAFCDALAQETTSTSNIAARAMNSALNNYNNPLLFSSSSSLMSSSSQLVLQSQLDTNQLYGLNSLVKREQQQDVNVVPPWLVSPSAVNLASPPPPLFSNNNTTLDHSFAAQTMSQKPNPSSTTTTSNIIINNNNIPVMSQQPSAFASATALLQKAAQMGATMSGNSHNRSSSSSSSPSPFSTFGVNVMQNAAVSGQMLNMADQYNDMMMSSLQTTSFGDTVAGGGGGGGSGGYVEVIPAGNSTGGGSNNNSSEAQLMRGGEGLTRDFLGLRTFPRREFFDMVGLNHHHHHLNSTAYGDNHHQKHRLDDHGQAPWQG